ncbi:MAG: hypothetical protein H6856_02120 [Rhodospirillales bacterium]|nr:hypothetical protein [Rhodospirillales bacterium]
MNSKWLAFPVLLWALTATYPQMLRAEGYAQEPDMQHFRHPLYDGVKRIYILVDYRDGGDTDDVPASLKRDFLEKLVSELYRTRFSSKDCKNVMGGTGPYSCNDQPVTIIPATDASNFLNKLDTSVATQEELRDPDTLLVVLDVNVVRDHRKDNPDYDKNVFFDPHLEVPLVAYQIRQERRVSRIGLDSTQWTMPPFALPLNQTDQKIKQHFESLIKERLHY